MLLSRAGRGKVVGVSRKGDVADDVMLDGRSATETTEATEGEAATGTVSMGPHSGGQPELVPEAVIDALVEVAWAFPGLRVSYARMFGRTLRHLASAGAEGLPDFTGSELDLSGAHKLLESFRTADQAIAIEDVTVDARTRPVAESLRAQGTRACLIWPVRRPRDPYPMGWIALDSDRPRTWGHKEESALERLDSLVMMALEHAELSEALSRARTQVLEHERRADGLRGFASGVLHHTSILVAGLMQVVARHMDERGGESATALGRQLEGVLAELEAVSHDSRARLPEPVDLNVVVAELLPALRVLIGEDARMLSRQTVDPLPILAHRAGLERMIFHLLAHAHAARSGGNSIVIETADVGGAAALTLYGDGLGIDDGLVQFGERGENVTADSLGMGLWVAHCEALLHSAVITVGAESGDQARIRMLFPLIG
jgi:hypothetical protein